MRPVKALADRLVPLKDRTAKDVDFVVFRENTEGIYVNIGGQFKRGTPDEIAINEDINTRKGVERLIRAGFDYAKKHGKKTVHMADKSNAMKHAHELWHRCFFEVAKEYPGIDAKHVYVDALCLYLVQDPRPFEVDRHEQPVRRHRHGPRRRRSRAASAWPRAPTSTTPTRKRVAMFEPVHGSAPPLVGKDLANPIASFLTVGHDARAPRLARGGDAHRVASCARAIETGNCTPDVGGKLGTKAVGEWIMSELRKA